MSSKRLLELLPVLSLLMAACLWGFFWYPLRLLDEAGLDGLWTTTIAYGAAMVVGLPYLWQKRREFMVNPAYLAIMGLASGWCNLAFILAAIEGTVVRVLLLFYLSPLWAVILARFWLGEQVSRRAAWVLLLAMSGALLMLWVPELGLPWPQSRADWLALSAGFAFAFANVLVRQRQEVSVAAKVFVTWWGGVVLALVWLLMMQAPWPGVGSGPVVGAVALGLGGMVLATLGVQYGVTHMPVQRSAVILLFELVVGSVSALLLTDEAVRPVEWLGGGLILLAAWLSARYQR